MNHVTISHGAMHHGTVNRCVAATAERPVAPAAAPSLDPSWWRGYNAGFAARMVASTAPVRLAAGRRAA